MNQAGSAADSIIAPCVSGQEFFNSLSQERSSVILADKQY
jgi:hypothetical protein